MAVIEIAKIQVRRGQENVTGVPMLDPGELGWAEDTQNLYIGKRISEGANSDNNTRILTEVDLRNIFNALGGGTTGSVASTSTYRYRDDLPYIHFASTTTNIAKKLDSTFANLTDFTQAVIEGTDITQLLGTAVSNLYANPYFTTSTICVLKLPAGNFIVSGVIDLPPYVNLVGEGPGITKLVLNGSGTGMFRTVDKLGAHYEQGMQFNGNASKNVSISNMTLAYSGSQSNDTPLISLDNTENPKIVNVEFTTANTTTGFVSTGRGIGIRGSIGSDESTVICRNIEIVDCTFSQLNVGVYGLGEVSKTVIEKNNFVNLNNGVVLASVNTNTSVPVDTLVSKNKFSFIYNEAIYTTTSTYASRVVSNENSFYYVGNNASTPDENITYQARSVMQFNTQGNVSLNDYFNREEVTKVPNFHYSPLASGNAKIINNRTKSLTVNGNSSNQYVIAIPLTGADQLAVIDYQLSNTDMSRKGRLTVNISSDGFASVSDYYNYSEVTTDASTLILFSTDLSKSPYMIAGNNYISITCSSFTSAVTQLEFTLDITV